MIYDGAGDNRPDIKNGVDHAYSTALQAQHHNHVHLASNGLGAGLGIDAGDGGGGGLLGGIWDSVTGVLSSLKDSVTGPLQALTTQFGDNSTLTKIAGAVPGKMVDGMWEGVKGKVTDIASNLWNGAKDLASSGWNTVKGAAGSVWDFVTGGNDNGDIKATVQKIAAQKGWGSGSEWAGLDYVISHESGWNPKAKNGSSTASGLGQFINATWNSYRGRSTAGTMAGAGVEDQAAAIMRYIGDRYHDPIGARAFWEKNHHYASGGPVLFDQGGVLEHGMTGVNKSGKPEGVLTNDQLGWLRSAASAPQQAPLIGGDLIIQPSAGESTHDQLDEAMFQLRRIARGGANARR